jgi:hypothetical protein
MIAVKIFLVAVSKNLNLEPILAKAKKGKGRKRRH